MLSRVVVDDKFPQCICLAPTLVFYYIYIMLKFQLIFVMPFYRHFKIRIFSRYELAMQIGEVVSKLTKFMPEITVHYAVKGVKGEILLNFFAYIPK